MATLTGNWNYPTSVKAGPGRISEIAAHCRDLGITRPLVVTDPGLARLPVVARVASLLEAGGLPTRVFSDVKGNPVGNNVTDGVAAYRLHGADGVVALGGGSALDVGKAVALMVGQSRPLWDYEDRDDWWTRIDGDRIAPILAVPTTSGTGSEVGRASVITNDETHRKIIIFHPRMLPGRVIADPELTVGLPPTLTAWTGMDALSHNLEAYFAPGFHPMADGIALEGARLAFVWLRAAVADGANVEARAMMMAASSMGAAAFQKGLGGMHALAHPIGARHDTHHGLTNAIVMPWVLRWNQAYIEERAARLARLCGFGDDFASLLDAVLALRADLGIPDTMSAVGLTSAHVPDLIPGVVDDPSASGNPRPIDEAGAAELLELVINGA
jgi:alcohol dehydrogenase class IV